MITQERYEMLREAYRKGADLAPVDFDDMEEYEEAVDPVLKRIQERFNNEIEGNVP